MIVDLRIDVHSRQFRRGTTCDLLYPERTEFRLEVVELFLEIIFPFAPELPGFHAGGIGLHLMSADVYDRCDE